MERGTGGVDVYGAPIGFARIGERSAELAAGLLIAFLEGGDIFVTLVSVGGPVTFGGDSSEAEGDAA
jgi:hypothetical protein